MKLLNPLSSTIEKGWKSFAIILANSSSSLFCCAGVIALYINWLIEVCVVVGHIPDAWGVVAAAGAGATGGVVAEAGMLACLFSSN